MPISRYGIGQSGVVDDVVDLDSAVNEIVRRLDRWRDAGLVVGPITWRDQGEGWPPSIKTERAEVSDADSVGITLRKGEQEGEVVLFKGGWCDFVFWTGEASNDPVQDAPGFPNEMTVERFGAVLDRLADYFQ